MIDHRPYFRQGTGKNAVLLIHGIAGSPGHFRDLTPVIPEEFSLCSILLAGHNGTVKDFSNASMAQWKSQVNETLADLFSRHEKVVIVGHSMGSLFAIRAALDHPDRIPALFLLNVPTRPWVRLSTWYTCLRVAFGKTDRPEDRAMRGETAIALTPKLWAYLSWIPRFWELLGECRRVRQLLPGLTVPSRVFLSRKDELVAFRTRKDLGNPCIRLTVLEHSGHFVYGPEDIPLLRRCLLAALEEIS